MSTEGNPPTNSQEDSQPFKSRTTSSQGRSEFERKIRDLAKIAAQADIKEGGFRVGANIAALLSFTLNFKKDHHHCGRLTAKTSEEGYIIGITCPKHGTSKAPKWKEREK